MVQAADGRLQGADGDGADRRRPTDSGRAGGGRWGQQSAADGRRGGQGQRQTAVGPTDGGRQWDWRTAADGPRWGGVDGRQQGTADGGHRWQVADGDLTAADGGRRTAVGPADGWTEVWLTDGGGQATAAAAGAGWQAAMRPTAVGPTSQGQVTAEPTGRALTRCQCAVWGGASTFHIFRKFLVDKFETVRKFWWTKLWRQVSQRDVAEG